MHGQDRIVGADMLLLSAIFAVIVSNCDSDSVDHFDFSFLVYFIIGKICFFWVYFIIRKIYFYFILLLSSFILAKSNI